MLIIGHRGFPARYPENTIISFKKAVEAGAAGVELDVWLSGDGRVVVIHDPDTERVAGVKYVVKETSYDKLSRLDLGMEQRIPLLGDVYEAVPRGKLVFVEIKDVDASQKALEIAMNKDRLEDTVFISFHPEALRRIRRVSREARLGYNIGGIEAAVQAPKLHQEIGLYSINPPIQGLQLLGLEKYREYLKQARLLGVKIFVWTINTAEEVAGIKDLIDGVITNNPEIRTQLLT